MMVELRPLGDSDLQVSTVALGGWPMAGLTSPGANDRDSIDTILACLDLGINHFDTAYMYGYEGESERLIGRALASRRDEVVIATKGGLHWNEDRQQVHDASPGRLRRECEESLVRLGTDRIELYYLHAPDRNVPIEETAGALRALRDAGKIRAVGVSNVTLDQMRAFASECPIAAYQPPYNMLQREIEADTLPWCLEHGVAVMVYWPLLKGLFGGKLGADHVFAATDSRRKYPMFQGDEWRKNVALVERLRAIAERSGHTVAQLVINWTIHRPGITSALCGAKRPEQIRETAGAMGWRLTVEELAEVDQALEQRGEPVTRNPV